jgi:hypothetical protein
MKLRTPVPLPGEIRSTIAACYGRGRRVHDAVTCILRFGQSVRVGRNGDRLRSDVTFRVSACRRFPGSVESLALLRLLTKLAA